MPHLSQLWSELSQKRADVVVLAVNLKDEKSVIEKYWKDGGFKHDPVMQQDNVVSAAFQVQAYPTNYVIGPDGKIAYRSVGWDRKEILAACKPNPPVADK